jgi:hypothetical protein
MPKCTPSQTSDPIDAGCGIFISPAGDDAAGDGSKEKPFATFKKGMEKGKTLYACTDGMKTFEEAVIVSEPGVFIFGALDCKTWTYNAATKTALTAKDTEVPLSVKASASVHVEDFSITAKDAPALKPDEHAAGNSSIAMLAEASSTLELVRVDATAGNGSDGAPGEPPMGTATAGANGDNGTGGCANDVEVGANGGQNMCAGTDVSGGFGGNGTKFASGAAGTDGSPGGMNAGKAIGGNYTCDTGGNGGNGLSQLTPGASGKGADMNANGSLSAKGFQGASGGDGEPGLPGQGGGGGGGAPKCANSKAGPSGGGGGGGGCGGAGGKGGYGGGASIVLASFGATLKFADVKMQAGKGGKGGAGASGQDGGAGGKGGMPGPADGTTMACPGGKGGAGGKGGQGGGGRGGHSIGIASVGASSPVDKAGATIMAGKAGVGGKGADAAGTGADGIAIDVQVF